MAGILDKKSRVMDVLLTQYGRKEFAKSGFNVEFFSFSDRNIDYKGDDNGAIDIDSSSIITFEPFSSDTDILIPEYSNAGDFTLTTSLSPDLFVENGILKTQQIGNDETVNVSDVVNFNLGDLELADLESNWSNLGVLRNRYYADEFALSQNSSTVTVSNTFVSSLPTDESILKPISIDPRFSRTVNTMVLEPSYKSGDSLIPLDVDEQPVQMSEEVFLNECISPMSVEFELGQGKLDIIGQILVKKDNKVRKLMVSAADETIGEDGEVIRKIFHVGELYKTTIENSSISTITRFGRTMTLIFHDGSL